MEVRLPKLGEGVDSGSVVALLVKEGDTISKGQTILELENEKAVAPIPSPVDGRVASIRVKAGDKLTVGQVILTVGNGGASSSSEASHTKSPAVETRTTPHSETREEPPPDHTSPAELDRSELSSTKAGFPPPASPTIRKLAKDLGIDLSRVSGSERGGRIVLQDLRAYIQRLQQLAFRARKEEAVRPASETPDFSKWGPVSSRPMSPLRQVISRRLSESWSTVPHVTQFDSADLTVVTDLRKKYAKAYEAQGAHLTVTAFVVKVIAGLLKKHPVFNCSIDETAQAVIYKEYCHIGLAVDTEAGLVVPVLRDADRKSLLQLSKEIHELAEKARNRSLTADQMKGGTFTISNQGGIGGAHFTPIINKPEVAILGLGRGAARPAVVQDKIVARLYLPLGLSYDHRLIDGAAAARFTVDLVSAIETFPEEAARI